MHIFNGHTYPWIFAVMVLIGRQGCPQTHTHTECVAANIAFLKRHNCKRGLPWVLLKSEKEKSPTALSDNQLPLQYWFSKYVLKSRKFLLVTHCCLSRDDNKRWWWRRRERIIIVMWWAMFAVRFFLPAHPLILCAMVVAGRTRITKPFSKAIKMFMSKTTFS